MTPSPTTPRPHTAPHHQPVTRVDTPHSHHEDNKPVTRASLASGVPGQKPLPTEAFPQGIQIPDNVDRPHRDGSQESVKSSRRDSMDVDMDDSDGEGMAGDDAGGSDDESVNADGTKSGKKKKSQRFYCTDYPPCNLSFTRSEHLARHIRKHTGERPFQCHCSRRFSRLDNLRQHAQTVHVNEDIPIDSLAATGSRFQRQIRTERVRQAGNRARASTSGSAGGPIRGHSKSLSTSSINSISSVGSNFTATSDARRRPPPLIMAAESGPRYSLDSYRASVENYRNNPDGTYGYRPASPSDFGTPTSATFSTGQSSPRWSGMASPSPSHSRSHSAYAVGTRTPGRRLSVPSGANPFQTPHGFPGRSVFGHSAMNSSNSAVFSTADSSLVSSPTASTFSGRRDSTSSATDEAWRRRTWHPDSRNYTGSQLSSVSESAVRTNPPPPIAQPSGPQSNLRLPGIESFGPITRAATPPRPGTSPMMVDSEPAPRPTGAPQLASLETDERRNLNLYDAGLQRGLNRLDIGPNTPPRDSAGAWASEVHRAVQAQVENSRMNGPTIRFEDQQPHYQNPNGPPPSAMRASRALHYQTMSAPSIATTSRDGKRHGWFNGPVSVHREFGPQEQPQGQDPRAAHVDRMVHPNFTGFSGFPAREQPPPQPQPPQERSPQGEPLGRLEALVAVATSGGSTATAY